MTFACSISCVEPMHRNVAASNRVENPADEQSHRSHRRELILSSIDAVERVVNMNKRRVLESVPCDWSPVTIGLMEAWSCRSRGVAFGPLVEGVEVAFCDDLLCYAQVYVPSREPAFDHVFDSLVQRYTRRYGDAVDVRSAYEIRLGRGSCGVGRGHYRWSTPLSQVVEVVQFCSSTDVYVMVRFASGAGVLKCLRQDVVSPDCSTSGSKQKLNDERRLASVEGVVSQYSSGVFEVDHGAVAAKLGYGM